MGIVKDKMFYPGRVENWIFLLDTKKIGVFGLPLKTLTKVISTMSLNFCTCLEKMYILNPSNGLEITWGTISVLIDHETRDKISFVSEKNWTKLQDGIDLSNLEMKYGGQR